MSCGSYGQNSPHKSYAGVYEENAVDDYVCVCVCVKNPKKTFDIFIPRFWPNSMGSTLLTLGEPRGKVTPMCWVIISHF